MSSDGHIDTLNLGFNKITAQGVDAIAQGLRDGASSLRVLSLTYNNIGDDGAAVRRLTNPAHLAHLIVLGHASLRVATYSASCRLLRA